MNVHKNARLTPHGRERIVRQVESGQTPKAVGEAAGVCPRTVRKWVSRYRSEGLAGLRDRSSRPYRLHRPTPQAVVTEVAALPMSALTEGLVTLPPTLSPSATVGAALRSSPAFEASPASASLPAPIRLWGTWSLRS